MKQTSKKQVKKARLSMLFYKELFMALLALLSVFFVFYEFVASPGQDTVQAIMRFDIVVAAIFFVDFITALAKAKDKRGYIRTNWYLLLAAIPIVDGWAELLRGLRIFELVRLIRAGSHIEYVYELSRHKS